ncbi:hypothetical protein VTN00DRAFT_10356 [Thermoascus crustaceus]|uniref:uncharacterized protein n=1 Tax=Thermoascus crustaceus TaxID=5088 RepID=UPI003744248D
MPPPSHHHPSPSSSPASSLPPPSPSCPFCAIASAYPPIPPSSFLSEPSSSITSIQTPQPETSAPQAQAHLVLSTQHVLAFLDIMPLTRGHVLVVTRGHWEDLGRVGVGVGMELGKWLPIISRVVMSVVLGKGKESDDKEDSNAQGQMQVQKWNWNVVQNNGTFAAQVVPHIHFHIIPRPPLTSTGASTGAGAGATKTGRSWIMFGRGQREELDDEEGEVLARAMREELAREVRRVREVEGVDLEFDLGGDEHGSARKGGGGGVKL